MIRARRSLVVLGVIALMAGAPTAHAGIAQAFEVGHVPPGLIIRGQQVVIHVDVQTSDGDLAPSAFVFLRSDPGAPFSRLRLFDGGTRRTVPAQLLDGSFLEDYVVIQDSGTDTVRRVPPTGAYRSWIRDSFHVVDLGRHVFGHVRAPTSIVARASTGDGPKQVGFHCPPEGLCDAPTSFDVGPSGEVWVVDQAHDRLLGWTPGEPAAPSRRIHVPIGMADIAVGPNGRVYVSGVLLGDPVERLSLYAYASNGHLVWHSHVLPQIFNDRLRFGPDGVLYDVDPLFGWVPVTDAHGNPLRIDQQRRMIRPDEPVAGGLQLVTRYQSQKEQRAALATDGGLLRRAWRITSNNVISTAVDGLPAAVDGDPVLDVTVYDFQHHRSEDVILRLSKTDGVTRKFSIARGLEFGGEVTTLRVGYDGAVYQLRGSADEGIRVVRYTL